MWYVFTICVCMCTFLHVSANSNITGGLTGALCAELHMFRSTPSSLLRLIQSSGLMLDWLSNKQAYHCGSALGVAYIPRVRETVNTYWLNTWVRGQSILGCHSTHRSAIVKDHVLSPCYNLFNTADRFGGERFRHSCFSITDKVRFCALVRLSWGFTQVFGWNKAGLYSGIEDQHSESLACFKASSI